MAINIKKLGSNLNTLLWNDTTKLGPAINFLTAANLGLVPNARTLSIVGENAEIELAGVRESVWMSGGDFEFPDSLDFYNLSSTDSEDGPGGDGALTVRVEGLDSNFLQSSETIILNGTSNVPTVKQYIHIQQITVVTAGDAGFNLGDLTAAGVSSSLAVAVADPERNGSANASFIVPGNETWYMMNLLLSVGLQESVTGKFIIQFTQDTIFQDSVIASVHSASSPFERIFESWPVLPPRTKVKTSVEMTQNESSAAVAFDVLAIDEQIGV